MNTIHFTFNSVRPDNFFFSLAAALGTEQVNGTIHIPSAAGTGFINRKTIGNDIVLLSWDLCMTRDMIFTKTPALSEENTNSFIISYLLGSENIYIKNAAGQRVRARASRNILFMSEDAQMQFEIPAGESFRVINICVPLRWLRTELSDAGPSFLDFLKNLGASDHPTVFMESSPPVEYRNLIELNSLQRVEEIGGLSIKAKVFSLVADFFSRIFTNSSKTVLDTRLLHHEKMLEVEGLLKKHLETTLPDIATIAKMKALSVSTLKRHFKLMFGKSIYEYYLELKMNHACELLTERNMSVNEVANMLEYEKVSCFIDIFKKHHGQSPGALRILRKKSA